MKAVFGFGRMNPITRGHERIGQKIESLCEELGGDPFLFFTKTQNEKNPLSPEDKLLFAEQAFPRIKVQLASTFFQACDVLAGLGYEEGILVAGADRVANFRERFLPYVGTEHLRLKRLDIVEVARPEGAISATAARTAAHAGNWLEFKSISAGNDDLARAMFRAVRKRMGMHSEFVDFLDIEIERRTIADGG